MEVSLFRNYASKQPMVSSLEAVVNMIREDRRVEAITDSYRVTQNKAVKESAPLFGVAAIFRNGKCKENISKLTGLSLVDIDHVNQGIKDEKRKSKNDKRNIDFVDHARGRGPASD